MQGVGVRLKNVFGACDCMLPLRPGCILSYENSFLCSVLLFTTLFLQTQCFQVAVLQHFRTAASNPLG